MDMTVGVRAHAERIFELRAQGFSYPTIAKEIGASASQVSGWMDRQKTKEAPVVEPLRNEMIQLHAEGLLHRDIALRLDIKVSRVGRLLRSEGKRPNHMKRQDVDEWHARCTKCGEVVNKEELPWMRRKEFSYQLSYCKPCRSNQTRSNNLRSTEQYFRYRHISTSGNCRRSGIAYQLSAEILLDMYRRQGGLCFYTDRAMSMPRSDEQPKVRDLLVVSIDKIVPELGYIPGNVVLCTMQANAIKSDCTMEEMQKWLPAWFARIEEWKLRGN